MRARRRSCLLVPGPQVAVPCAVLGRGPHICRKVPPGGLRAWAVHPAGGEFPPLPATDSSDVALTGQLKSREASMGLKFTWRWSLDDAVPDKPWARPVCGGVVADGFLMGASRIVDFSEIFLSFYIGSLFSGLPLGSFSSVFASCMKNATHQAVFGITIFFKCHVSLLIESVSVLVCVCAHAPVHCSPWIPSTARGEPGAHPCLPHG